MPDLVEPAHLWVPERVGSYGDEAVDLARRAGRELDPEQVLAVDALLSYGKGGRWLTLETAVIEGRQNGKTGGVLLPVVLYDLFLGPSDRIVWTAHLFRTARDAFNDIIAAIDRTAELSARVKRISYANGEEAVELHSGAKLEFLARSKGGGRGLGGKRLVMDEALFLSAEAMGALIPTLSAREDPQINYGSSAGVAGSDHLRRLRDRGRAGGDPSLIWVEWCAPGSWEDPPCLPGTSCPHVVDTYGCALDDEDLWRTANPALGRRITYEYIRSERRALPVLEFGRERLGWFEEPSKASESPITTAAWDALVDEQSWAEDPVAFGVDTTPDAAWTSIVTAGRGPDGRTHLELVDHLRGTEWVVGRLVELRDKWSPCAIVIDPAGPAGAFIKELAEHGIRPKPDPSETQLEILSVREAAQACGALANAVRDDKLRHLGEPELNAAVAGAKRRMVSDAWLWDRKSSDIDISPLVAATIAQHGFATYGTEPTYDVLDSVY